MNATASAPPPGELFVELLDRLQGAALGRSAWREVLGPLMQLGRCEGTEPRALHRAALRHLRHALEVARRLDEAARRAAALECAAGSLPCGLLLLDAQGAVLFASERALSLLRGRRGARFSGAALLDVRGLDERALGRALDRLATAASPEGAEAFCLQLPGHGGQGPLRMLLMRAAGGAAPAGAVLGLLSARDQRGVLPGAALLRDVYGFSPAEAELAGLLVSGQSLMEAARTRDVSLNTARSQLKGVLRKTGCRNQADLMRMLIAGPDGLLHGLAPSVAAARGR